MRTRPVKKCPCPRNTPPRGTDPTQPILRLRAWCAAALRLWVFVFGDTRRSLSAQSGSVDQGADESAELLLGLGGSPDAYGFSALRADRWAHQQLASNSACVHVGRRTVRSTTTGPWSLRLRTSRGSRWRSESPDQTPPLPGAHGHPEDCCQSSAACFREHD
jgi:hypothetical protein